MRQLTIRNVSDPLGRKLEELSRRTGKSINTLALELLNGALGVKGRSARLKSYITCVREFDEALEPQRQVDEGLWR